MAGLTAKAALDLNPASGGRTKFIDRLSSITPHNSDVLVIMGGFNDNTFSNASYTPAAVGTAAALFSAIATALPKVDLFVTSSQASTTPFTEPLNRSAAIAAAATAAPNVKKYINMTDSTNPWIKGEGKVGATTGQGNANLYVHNDCAHPSPAGHNYYAQRMAAEIKGYYLGRS
ncbi:hypothetical protein [Geodermatophilus sp. URMC 63]